MTALTFGGTLIVPALCRRLLPPAAARKVPTVSQRRPTQLMKTLARLTKHALL